MNDFIAKDTCILCGDIVGVAINQRLKPINDGPHTLSLCNKCKQKLTDGKRLLVIEVTMNNKGRITGITRRVAQINEEALKENAPNYKKIMEDRVIMVNEDTFNYLLDLESKKDEA